MVKPNVLVLAGYGINCDEETKYAFETSGANADIVHINDLIDGHKQLSDYQIFAIPGGFSYGDDTGSGKALANKIRTNLGDKLREFLSKDNLAIGICNGFQVMVALGILPGLNGNEKQVALVHNKDARYLDRWVDLKFKSQSPWCKEISTIALPIAHGEGKFYAQDDVLKKLNEQGLIAARYTSGEMCAYQNLPANPNGALEDIASITDKTGRIIGMMPHPERAINFTQLPNWPLIKEDCKRKKIELPKQGPGLQLFRNGVEYFA